MSGAFRRFRVAARHPENAIVTSFHLEPVDGGPLWPARPGQYLTLRVPSAGGTVLKTYSLSGDVTAPGAHRITVKREGRPANRPDVPEGIGSCWLHDRVRQGDEIEVAAPRGVFVLDEASPRPVVLLSGGVGLTPVVSMLHALAPSGRAVWFIHACENGAAHALRDEVAGLAARAAGRVRLHVAYRTPLPEDRTGRRFDSEGVIDRQVLQSLLPLDDYDIYMCGPTPFMAAMFRLLTGLGVAKDRIHYEFFGKAKSLEALAAGPKVAPAAPAMPKTAAAPAGSEVVFSRSGLTVPWDDSADSLLDLAERAGLTPTFSCRTGICNSCRCDLSEGEVAYFEEPLDAPGPNRVLICCSKPVGRVVLDL